MSESVVLGYFREISAIPRASFQEKAISDYLVAFAKELGLRYVQDDVYNVVIFKDASAGYEKAPAVMLQSHIDMVAEKNKDSDHNFDTDPLDLYIEDGFLHARGTTLGADDGAGVVYMMALLADKEAKHPALECVFTVQEETGLTGAALLDTSALKATLCVGLDGSGETETYVSSSGGVRGKLERTVQVETVDSLAVTVRIRGLLGGHSGGEIDQERGNASKIAGFILRRALDTFPKLRLVEMDGGLKMNAITREHDFTIAIEDPEAFKTWFKDVEREFKTQYEFSDAGLEFLLETGHVNSAVSADDTAAIVNLLLMLPYGVIQKSKAIADLVITSANIGTVNLNSDRIEITISLRATQAFVIENIMRQVEFLAKTTGFSLEFSSKYPGWEYDANSKFRARLSEVHKALRGKDMDMVATHGGLELGIWKDKLPDLDIVSFGPIMFDIHTPKERLDIASLDRTYELLVKLLESLDTF